MKKKENFLTIYVDKIENTAKQPSLLPRATNIECHLSSDNMSLHTRCSKNEPS